MAKETELTDWVFGYGSLIFRTEFPFIEQRPAYIKHWARRFWQGSTDHRGTPEAPGRVVTLVESPEEQCWGMAYRLAADEWEQVMTALDYREKGGYERLVLPLHFADGTNTKGITYHAVEGNPNYLGAAPLEDMARQIHQSNGPSGANIDYLHQLAAALTDLNVKDPHVIELCSAVEAVNRR